MLVIFNCVVASNIPSKRVTSQHKILDTPNLYPPFFDIAYKVIYRFLRGKFEPKKVVRPTAPAHAYYVNKVDLEHL